MHGVSIETVGYLAQRFTSKHGYTGTRVPAFEYRARTRDDTIATSKTIKMPCSTKGVYWSRRRQEYVREASPSIRNSDDAIMLTTLPTETIYKLLSRQVTLNYEALYYGGTLEDAERAESLLQNRATSPLLSHSDPANVACVCEFRVSHEHDPGN